LDGIKPDGQSNLTTPMNTPDLKTIYTWLRFLENPAEVKRKLPTALTQRPLKEGLLDVVRLLGGVTPGPQLLSELIGEHRFGLFHNELSAMDAVAHAFETARIIFTIVIDPNHFETAQPTRPGITQPTPPKQTAPLGIPADRMHTTPEGKTEEPGIATIRQCLSTKPELGVRLFRVIFEFVLGTTSSVSIQSGALTHANELLGRRDVARVFLADAIYILGILAGFTPEEVTCFMAEHHLLGVNLLEHKLLNRDYCNAYYQFRKLRRAFSGPAEVEEARLKARVEKLLSQCGGSWTSKTLLEGGEVDKIHIDSCDAAIDLVEVLSMTVMSSCFRNAMKTDGDVCEGLIRSLAVGFKKFAYRQQPSEVVNRELGELLFAFGMQYGCQPMCA